MKKVISFISIILFSVCLISCGSSSLSSTDEGDIPSWYLTTPENSNYFYAVSTSTSKDMQLSVEKAAIDARNDIGSQVEIKINSLQKSFSEEVGQGEAPTLLQQFTSATKTVVSTTLTGSKVVEKEIVKDGDNYRAYVLVEYPVGKSSLELMEQLKNNEELYTRFRSSQAYKELDEEVKKYEELKENNN